jgi:drug/metabolite transporter (DMT)-like permease
VIEILHVDFPDDYYILKLLMHNTLFIAIVTGLIAMIGWGTADFFAKKTIDKIGDVATLFWGQLLGLIPLLGIFLVSPHIDHLNHFDPLFLILFGVFSALTYLPLYNAFGKGQISIISPIFGAYSVMVVILAAIFLHAGLAPLQKIAIVLVVLGIFLVSTDITELRQSLRVKSRRLKGVPEVVTAMLSYSIWLVFLDNFLSGRDWVFPLLAIRISAVITLIVYAAVSKQSLKVTDQSLWKFLAVIGLFDVAAFAAVSYGYSHTSYIAIVTVLSATFSLPTIVLAYFFLKERIKPLQIAAAAFILVGVVLVSLS